MWLTRYYKCALLLACLMDLGIGEPELVQCKYVKSQNRIDCWETRYNNCTADPAKCISCETYESTGLLAGGIYRVGPNQGTEDSPTFQLYYKSFANQGNYWDSNTFVPEAGCHMGFAMHSGNNSMNHITVVDQCCFNRLKEVIFGQLGIGIRFSVMFCTSCRFDKCLMKTLNPTVQHFVATIAVTN